MNAQSKLKSNKTFSRIVLAVFALVLIVVLGGAAYAQTQFVLPKGGVDQPVGVAASKDAMFFTARWSAGLPLNIYSVNASGVATVFANVPPPVVAGNGTEVAIAICPGLGQWQAKKNWIYVTSGPKIWEYQPNGVMTTTPFATIDSGVTPGEWGINHTNLAFDTVGSWNYDLIATGDIKGTVSRINSTGTTSLITTITTVAPYGIFPISSAAVAPPSFSPFGGYIFVTDSSNKIWKINPPPNSAATVFLDNFPTGTPGALNDDLERINFVPSPVCTFSTTNYSFFDVIFTANDGQWQELSRNNGDVLGFPSSAFSSVQGKMLISAEHGGKLWTVGPNAVATPFVSGLVGQQEDSAFVSCVDPPGTGCPATKGFWKNDKKHPFPPGFAPLTLTPFHYTNADLLNILGLPGGGNGVAIMGSQLVAALANVAAGAKLTPAGSAAIAAAENLLANGIPGQLGPFNMLTGYAAASSPLGQQMVAVGSQLDAYNSATGLSCSEGAGLRLGTTGK